MSHKREAIVVHCMDQCLQSRINRWLEGNPPRGSCDRAAMAGGVFDVDDGVRQADIAARLHEINKVVLINHEDCGMCGTACTEERHEEGLKNAVDKIRRRFPHLEVDTYSHSLGGRLEQNS